MTEPFSILLSYWYFRNDNAIGTVTSALRAAQERGATVRLLVDSGAFSADSQGAAITVADYARWLDTVAVPEWGPWLVGALSLDVLRDPEASWSNWVALRDRGHDTIPVTHMGDGFDVLDRYANEGADYIALGAMVGRSMTRKLRWSAHVHRHVRDNHPDVRLHGLGVSSQQMVERLPWWSVDASSFGSAYRYGRAKLYDPATGRFVSVALDGSADTHRHGRLLRDVYGVDPSAIRKSSAKNRPLLIALSARTVVEWQRAIRAARPVSPPPSRSLAGTHVHMVDGSPEMAAGFVTAGTHVHLAEADPTGLGSAVTSTTEGPPDG